MQSYSIVGTIRKIFPPNRDGFVYVNLKPQTAPIELPVRLSHEKAANMQTFAEGDILCVVGTPMYTETSQGLVMAFVKAAYVSRIEIEPLQASSIPDSESLGLQPDFDAQFALGVASHPGV